MTRPVIRLLDRAKETTTTTGSGTITLGGAGAGFVPISGIGSGNSTYYTLEEASSFEVGIGTYDSVGNIFSRDEIFSSSNEDNSKIGLSGNATIFITYPADKALVKTSGNLVGIGVDPEYQLQVSGTGAFDTIRWSDGTTQTVSATGDISANAIAIANITGGDSTGVFNQLDVGVGGITNDGVMIISGDIINNSAAENKNDIIIGAGAIPNIDSILPSTGTVIIGSQAGQTLTDKHNNTLIGAFADVATNQSDNAVAIGKGSKSHQQSVIIATNDFTGVDGNLQGGKRCVGIGYGALTGVNNAAVVAIGYQANATTGVGGASIAIGDRSIAKGIGSIGIGAQTNSALNDPDDNSYSISIGGYSSSESKGIALGYFSNSPKSGFVVSMGLGTSYNLLSGNFGDKFVVSNAKLGINDTTPDAMIDVVAANNTDVGIIIEGAASQTANLTEWQDSSSIVWASVDPTGRISASGGLVLPANIPSVTTNTIYNSGGVLYFNGSGVNGAGGGGGGTTYTAGSGLQLNGTVFDALTATTSASGITQLQDSATDGTTDKAITPNAVYDISGVLSSDVASTGATNAAAIATNTTNIASTGATNAAAAATNATNISTNTTNTRFYWRH